MNNVSDSDGVASPQELAVLVAGMNRFLMRLSNILPFQEAGVGLAEWSALSLIASRDGMNNRQIANLLGVSPQRVNQITDSLRREALINIGLSIDDARKKIITLTPLGMARMRELNGKLQQRLDLALQKRPRLITRINGLLSKTLMRIVAQPQQAPRIAVDKGRRRSPEY